MYLLICSTNSVVVRMRLACMPLLIRATLPTMLIRYGVILLLMQLTNAAFAGPTSEYTSTAEKAGKTVVSAPSEADPDGSTMQISPGLGGYELILFGDDERTWINVRSGETTTDLYAVTMENAPGFFPRKANDVVEWRGIHQGGKFTPYAIIYRMEGLDDMGKVAATRLLVFGLKAGKAEFLGSAQGAGEGEKARAIADTFGL